MWTSGKGEGSTAVCMCCVVCPNYIKGLLKSIYINEGPLIAPLKTPYFNFTLHSIHKVDEVFNHRIDYSGF